VRRRRHFLPKQIYRTDELIDFAKKLNIGDVSKRNTIAELKALIGETLI
jgi:hypothetical protein